MKFPRNCWRSWENLGEIVWGGRPRPAGIQRLRQAHGVRIGARHPHSTSLRAGPSHTNLNLIMPMKTRTSQRHGTKKPKQHANRLRPSTTPSKTLPSSSPRAERNSLSRKSQSKNPKVVAVSAPGKMCGILNMEKERSIIAREKAKRPRLRYNFLASD